MFLVISTLGYFLLAVVFVLDKLILTKSVAKPAVYAFYSTIFLLAAFLLWPFMELPTAIDMWWGIFSGLTFGLGMWTMFIAIKRSEASHMSPFIGAVITIATYIFSFIFLGEVLTPLQSGGVMVLACASLIVSFEKTKTHSGFHAGFLWGIASGIIFAASLVASKYLYDQYSFLTGLIWSRGTAGLFGLFLLVVPSVRHALLHKKTWHPHSYAKRHARAIVIANKVLSVIGITMLHYAIAIGSVTIVNALAGIQEVFTFIIVYLLTCCVPKILKEYFTKREFALELVGVLLVVLGSVMIAL